MSYLTDRLPQYADDLLDFVKKEMNLRNDADLCRLMGINQATMSRIRHQKPHKQTGAVARIGDPHILALYDSTGFSIEQLRSVLHRKEFKRQTPAPFELVQKRLAEDNALMSERQRQYRESIKNKPTPEPQNA